MSETTQPFKVAVTSLWPTVVARYVVDGHEKQAAGLAALVDAPGDGDPFAVDSAAVRWLKKRIDATVAAYFEHFTEVDRCAWRVEGRLVVRRFGEFQPIGNAPGRYLGGVYIVSAPTKARALRLRADVVSNGITLLDPRYGMNMNAINDDPYVGQLKTEFAEPGLLMMWPSFVNRWSTPNLCDDPLVAIEFDVTVVDGAGKPSWKRPRKAPKKAVAGPGRDAFREMWRTYIVRRQIEDCARWNDDIASLVAAMEDKHKDLTTDYLGVDLFNREEPAIRWLRARIEETVNEYFFKVVKRSQMRWYLQGWPNINRFGDYHQPHNHCWCYLSGTYYVRLPQAENPNAGTPLPSGAINFHDPRQAANVAAVAGDPYSKPHHTVVPRPGTLMMWPASLLHNVYPNLSESRRISLSFNVVLEWSNDLMK